MFVAFVKLLLVPVYVPVMVTVVVAVYVGGGPVKVDVLYSEVSVSVALPDVAIDAVGQADGKHQLAVTPAGIPLADNATGPVNPLSGDTVTL